MSAETPPRGIPGTPTAKDGPIHSFFGLTYANYLVLPRTLLQSMPLDWQEQFVALLDEMHDAFAHLERPNLYAVCVDRQGRFIRDTVPHYSRGRTYVQPDPEWAERYSEQRSNASSSPQLNQEAGSDG